MLSYLVLSAVLHLYKWFRQGDKVERYIEEFDVDDYENEQDYY